MYRKAIALSFGLALLFALLPAAAALSFGDERDGNATTVSVPITFEPGADGKDPLTMGFGSGPGGDDCGIGEGPVDASRF